MNNIPSGYNSEGKYNGSSDPEFGHDFIEDEYDELEEN